jgi:hypothetical protein
MRKLFLVGRKERPPLAADPPRWSPPRTGARLASQVRDVVDDLPRFLGAPLQRRWHQTWGATPAEVAAEMPGDRLLPRAQYRCTRAITIRAKPEEVWPWLVQVGVLRGGWYADDLLDNFARPSVRRIVPELQDIRVGQWLAMVPRPSERTAFVVDSFAQPSWLLWRSPNRTFAWRLIRLGDERTRLIARLQTVYEWRRPLTLGTMRRMLLGIRERVEAGQPIAAGSQ